MRVMMLIALLAGPAAAQDVRFEDARGALPGPDHVYGGGWEHFVGGGVAVMDCNADGRPDIFVAGGENPARLFINQTVEAMAFADGAIPALTGVTGAYPIDIDGDGHADLVVLRVGENLVMRGDGTCHFARANEVWGFDGGDAWSTAFSATWEPGARAPTLAIGNYVDRSDPSGPFFACDENALHRPEGDAYARIPLTPGFCALSALFSDIDGDGRAELRLSNDRHYYVRDGYEQLWDLDPLAERVASGAWDPVAIWGMGIASRDLTGDGRPEVMLTSMGDQLLMIAEGEGYVRAPLSLGTYATRPHTGEDGRPSTGWHAEFADVNNDGLPDLFIAKGNVDQMPDMAMADPNNLLLQRADGTFTEIGATAGIATPDRARGAAFADFDGDGRLDLVVVNRRAPMELWRNVTDAAPAVFVTLRANGPNRDAVGAVVELRQDTHLQRIERTVGGGHVSGALVPLHFGLGAGGPALVRVLWPGQTTPSAWLAVPAGARHVTLAQTARGDTVLTSH
ncbi:MAG: CRTAC1 family protein [Pseudomonadota bacterium]